MAGRAQLWTLVALLSLGCARVVGSSGPTDVARQQVHATGVSDFDAYFIELHRIQVGVAPLGGELSQLETELALAAGRDRLTSRQVLEKTLAESAARLREAGTKLALSVEGLAEHEPPPEDEEPPREFVARRDAKGEIEVRFVVEGNAPAAEDRAWLDAAKKTAKGAARVVAQSSELGWRARILQPHTELLERRVEAEFRLLGPAKTGDVRRNLMDAKPEFPRLRKASEQARVDGLELLQMLERVLNEPAPAKAAPKK